MIEDKIINNSFDKVDYGIERTTQSAIQIHPAVEGQYEESTSENIDEVYTRRRLMELMDELYRESPFFEKYKQNLKKVERGDFYNIYYHFKDELMKRNEFTMVQIFCTIAEFFDMNYKILYNDVLALEDKVKILDHLEREFGLEREFNNSKSLF